MKIKESGLSFSEVLSSEWCRKETAQSDIGQWETFSIKLFFQNYADRVETLHKLDIKL